MNLILLKDIFGIIFIITSYFDAIKYIWQSKAIKKAGTAKGQSRKFINAAIFNDIAKLIYAILIKDIFIGISAIIALMTMIHCFYTIYKYYPYRMRGCQNFKRPNILLYLMNSLQPNSIRKRL
jgi:hypothetical protein